MEAPPAPRPDDGTSGLSAFVRHHAATRPDAPAFLGEGAPVSWREYDARADRLACALRARGLAPGQHVGVLLPDGPEVHTAFLACERAGLVAVGIGARTGPRELAHLLTRAEVAGLLTGEHHQEEPIEVHVRSLRDGGLALPVHLILPESPDSIDELYRDASPGARAAGAAFDPAELSPLALDDVWLLNSTSGTTGMPKLVVHDLARWLAFHRFAVRSGELSSDDVFMSVVPAPFGFGLWTSHVTPAVLGVPLVVCPRFDAGRVLGLLERHTVTVLAAVTTQFILMLEAEGMGDHDLGALRVLFTGGEAVPYARALAFEERTGARVLQFYGSNETGAVCGTGLSDPADKRLRTAGRPVPEMNLRLFDEHGGDVTAQGEGQPGVRGPTLSRGYYRDDAANAELVRADGWMLLGDRVRVDAEGYVHVIGRIDDFIIRGGKNISARAVEDAVTAHPDVRLAGAVALPDPVFGERVCVFVELTAPGSLELEDLTAWLRGQGVSKESLPERLVVLPSLPMGAGGKVAKGQLRERARRLAAGDLDA